MNLIKFEKIDPPGTFCTWFGLSDLIQKTDLKQVRFLEIGCGEGTFSKFVLEQGANGISIDYSERAIEIARKNLAEFLLDGKVELQKINFLIDDLAPLGTFDLIFSVMVLEHVSDEDFFLKKIFQHLKPDGIAVIIVPSNPDAWGIEDRLAGHLRRYTKSSLEQVCIRNNLKVLRNYSLGVPVVNILFSISNFLVARDEKNKDVMNQQEQTKLSGSREIPFKTVFPVPFKLILNQWTLWPLKILQRLFYRTNKGLITGIAMKRDL